MRFEGRVWKDGKYWLIEVPAFDALTQGRTKEEAYEMIQDLLETMANSPGFKVEIEKTSGERFLLNGDTRTLTALLLRRQRESRGITLAEAAQRLHQGSRNSYARYEQGKAMPSVEKIEELLHSVASDRRLVWRLDP